MFFSIIVPLYNRPVEIKEMLTSLLDQSYKDFEVIVVEDGSSVKSEHIVNKFKDMGLREPAEIFLSSLTLI